MAVNRSVFNPINPTGSFNDISPAGSFILNWQYRDKSHLCQYYGNVATRFTYVRTMAISRQGLRQYRDMCQTKLYSYRKTSWIILIAQCDGNQCTLQAFEQFGHIGNDWSAPCPQTRYVLLMLSHCLSSVADGDPTSKQNSANVSCQICIKSAIFFSFHF